MEYFNNSRICITSFLKIIKKNIRENTSLLKPLALALIAVGLSQFAFAQTAQEAINTGGTAATNLNTSGSSATTVGNASSQTSINGSSATYDTNSAGTVITGTNTNATAGAGSIGVLVNSSNGLIDIRSTGAGDAAQFNYTGNTTTRLGNSTGSTEIYGSVTSLNGGGLYVNETTTLRNTLTMQNGIGGPTTATISNLGAASFTSLAVSGSSTTTGITNTGAFTETGTANINTTGSATTNIGNAASSNNIVGTNTISGTNNIVGTTSINTSGSSTTQIGHTGGGSVSLYGTSVQINNSGTGSTIIGANNASSAVVMQGGSISIGLDPATTVGSSISFNGNTLQNVAAATSTTDAVNLGQLQNGTTAISVASVNAGSGAIQTTGAVQAGTLTTTGNTTIGSASNSTVSVGNQTGSVGTSTVSFNNNRLQNVAAATATTDAVNLGQVNALIAASGGGGNYATQTQVNGIQNQVNNIQSQVTQNNLVAQRGIAGVSAIAGLPALESNKNFGIGIGVGNYVSATALAVGAHARLSDNVVLKVAGSSSTGSYATSAGLGVSF